MACLLNYSYQMCILVLTDRSGNGVMLKLSLNNGGAEVNLRRAVKYSRTLLLVKCSAPLINSFTFQMSFFNILSTLYVFFYSSMWHLISELSGIIDQTYYTLMSSQGRHFYVRLSVLCSGLSLRNCSLYPDWNILLYCSHYFYLIFFPISSQFLSLFQLGLGT